MIITCIIILIFVVSCIYIKYEISKSIYVLPFLGSVKDLKFPIITFDCQGKKLNFIIDTGSMDSIIDSEVCSTLEGRLLNKQSTIYGLNGMLSRAYYILIDLEYKGNKVENLFLTADIKETMKDFKESKGIEIHGLIGSKFLNMYQSVIDYKKECLTFK